MKNIYISTLSCLLMTGVSLGTTWTVDDDGKDYPQADFDNIQAAVDASSDGDEILIYPGTYTGSGDEVVNTLGKAIWLHSSEDNPTNTIIDGENQRRGITCQETTGKGEVTISGLYILYGYADLGGGLWIEGNPTVSFCWILNSEAIGNGGNVFVNAGSPLFDSGCNFNGGTAQYGGGVYCKDGSPEFSWCFINYNTATARGGGMRGLRLAATLTNCVFYGNTATEGGGPFFTYDSDDGVGSTFTNCRFQNNTASAGKGGGVMNQYSAISLFDTCEFTYNETSQQGGGMYTDSAHPVIVDCVFEENSASSKGGALYGYNSSPDIDSCLFSSNSSGSNYGVVHTDGNAGVTVGTSTFCENIPTDLSGIYTDEGTNCFADSCTDSDDDGTLDDCDGFHHVYNGESIQDAVDAASDGDTILVHEGTYSSSGIAELIAVWSSDAVNLSIIGDVDEYGNPLTILDADGSGGVISVIRNDNLQDDLRFENLVITNGDASVYAESIGGGIYISTGNATFENCEIWDNNAGTGGGVGIHNNGYGIFENCVFSNNTGTTGAALYQTSYGRNASGDEVDTMLTNCMFDENGDIYLDYASASLEGSTTVDYDEDGTLEGVSVSGYVANYIFSGDNEMYQSAFYESVTLTYEGDSSCVVDDSWQLYTHFCVVNTEFQIDELDNEEFLTVNGTMIRGGSVSITDESGNLFNAPAGTVVPLVQANYLYPSLNFAGTVFPVMREGFGLEYVPNNGNDISIQVVALNEGEGDDFDDPGSLIVGIEPDDLLSFDMDGDGKDEIAAMYPSYYDGAVVGKIYIYRVDESTDPDNPSVPEIIRNSDGSVFTTYVNYATDLDAGDLDGDGKEDLVAANVNDESIQVLLSSTEDNGDPMFDKSTITLENDSIDEELTCIAIIDWDGDANLDVVVGSDYGEEETEDAFKVLLDVADLGLGSHFGPTISIPSSPEGIDTANCVDGGNRDSAWGFVSGTKNGQALRVSPNGSSAAVANLADTTLGNLVFIDARELSDGEGDGYIDIIAASDETQSLYIFQGSDSAHGVDVDGDDDFDIVISLEVSVSVKDVYAIDSDGDDDMDFVIAAPESEETPFLLLRNGGANSNIAGPPATLHGRDWSGQGIASSSHPGRVTGGTLGGKDEKDDWLICVGDPPNHDLRDNCMMEQTNLNFTRTWIVDDDGEADFNNIQAAVDIADDGDSIMVMPGTYYGSGNNIVNMLGKEIRLYSKTGSERTIIDGQEIRRGIICTNGETALCSIEGFTIQNAESSYTQDSDRGGGMFVNYSSPSVLNCEFVNNNSELGGALYSSFSNDMLIQNCEFNGNTSSNKGAGIRSWSSSLTIDTCTFVHNDATYEGGAIAISSDEPDISNSTFCDNSPEHIAGTYVDLGGNVFQDYCCHPADLNADGTVNVLDLLALIAAWGDCEGCDADFDGNGQVAVADLLVLIAEWGSCDF